MTTALTAITTHNYKNLHLAGGLTLGRLNILIGPNGSGKSNLISMLQFLQQAVAEGGRDPIRGRTSFEDAVFNLGGGRLLDGTVAAPATVNLNYRFANTKAQSLLQIELLVQNLHRQVIIAHESFLREQGLPEPVTIYQAHAAHVGGSGRGSVAVFADTENRNSPITHEQVGGIPVNELALAVMPKLLETSAFPPERTPVYEARRDILDAVVACSPKTRAKANGAAGIWDHW